MHALRRYAVSRVSRVSPASFVSPISSGRAILLMLLAGCASPPAPAPKPPVPVAAEPKTTFPEARADGRLPALASPVRYALSLTVDPDKERFEGAVTIDVSIPAPTSYVVLHGRSLQVKSASALAGGRTVSAKVTPRVATGGDVPEELVLEFDHVLPSGPAKLSLAWDAPFDSELSGLYRVKEGDRWYAFTQFESTDARRAFPCFDEPGFKVPFDVSVTVPKGMIAVANTPEASRHDTTFRFKPTPALPTYLVALAVGDFDVKEANRTKNPPIRVVTTKGKSALTDLALESTGALVDGLADWFGIPYPYEKLDIVAVPEFAAGAMENAGLITFRSELLLLDPGRASVRIRRSQARVVAHELAHQWFGNLVTAAWWNDIWLNEGMATWMEWHAVDQWRPAWGVRDDAAIGALEVMDQDALVSSRAVRQPVKTTSEIEEAFDSITYEKGAAVLSTIERWVGEAAFKRGIQSYLRDNAGQSVTTDRLFLALDRATGKDVTRMAATFLDRPGVPVVSVERTCESGGRWHAELSQRPWRPLGSPGPEVEQSWTIPVCLRAKGQKGDVCADLSQGAPSLAAGRGCPAWVHPNATGSYYRFDLSEKELLALGAARAELDVPQRVAVIANAWASVRAGKLDPGAMAKLLAAFDDDPSKHVTSSVIGVLYGMSEAIVGTDARPAFEKLVGARLTKKKAALGWIAKKDETGDAAILRRAVMSAMGNLAQDETTLREAEAIASRWLVDPASVDSDIAPEALDLASRRAGEPRLAQLRQAVKTAKTDEDRVAALRALGGFDDEKVLTHALDLLLTDEIRVHDMRYVLNAAFGRRKVRNVTETWVRAHWDELRKRLPGSLGRTLMHGASNACAKDEVEERRAWYTPRIAGIPAATRGLAEGLESGTLCAALRSSAEAAFTKALVRSAAAPAR